MADPTIQLIAKIVIIILFLTTFFVFSQEKMDHVAFSLLFAVLACIITAAVVENFNPQAFILYIPFQTLLYLLAMNLIIILVEQQKIFQYFAVRIIHLTRSNPRYFFYLICSLSSLFSGLMEDVSVTIIFIPLVIRACRILKIDTKPYIFGIGFSICIGNLLTPFANASNIIISDLFQLNIGWYLGKFILFYIVFQILFLLIIDFKMVRLIPHPSETQKAILMEIMDPNLVIINRRRFFRNMAYLIIVFTALFLSPVPYLVVVISVLLLSLFEREPLPKYLARTNWNLIFVLISIFLMVDCLILLGIVDIIINFISQIISEKIFIAVLVTIVFSSLLSSFTSRTMTMVIFASLFESIFLNTFPTQGEHDLLLMALVIGGNLGGILLPHASSHILRILNYSEEEKIPGVNYRSVLKVCVYFVAIAIVLGLIYLAIYSLFL